MNHMRQAVLWAATGIVAMTLAACAGFGGATIGGTLGGLGTGLNVVLQDNGADNLTLTANGSFTFATNIGEGKTYNVTVATQPAGQVCTVANGSGTVDKSGTDVTGVPLGAPSSTKTSGCGRLLAETGTRVPIPSSGSHVAPVAALWASRYAKIFPAMI